MTVYSKAYFSIQLEFAEKVAEISKEELEDVLLLKKTEPVNNFKSCLKDKITLNELLDCFPYKVLEPSADLKYFFDFYKVK